MTDRRGMTETMQNIDRRLSLDTFRTTQCCSLWKKRPKETLQDGAPSFSARLKTRRDSKSTAPQRVKERAAELEEGRPLRRLAAHRLMNKSFFGQCMRYASRWSEIALSVSPAGCLMHDTPMSKRSPPVQRSQRASPSRRWLGAAPT